MFLEEILSYWIYLHFCKFVFFLAKFSDLACVVSSILFLYRLIAYIHNMVLFLIAIMDFLHDMLCKTRSLRWMSVLYDLAYVEPCNIFLIIVG